MKLAGTILGLFLVMVGFTNCERYRCIKGDDNLVTYEVEVDTFFQITSQVNFDVHVQQDTMTEIVIQADENLIPYIETEIIGSELIISTANDRCLRSRNDIRVFVKTVDIDRVILDGSGDILIDDITTVDLKIENNGSGLISLTDLYTDDLQVDLHGSGDILIYTIDALTIDAILGGSGDIDLGRGIANTGILEIDGSGSIYADAVELLECEVIIDGSGDITVWAKEHLYGEIFGSGAVFYRMLPTKGIHINNMTPENVLPL